MSDMGFRFKSFRLLLGGIMIIIVAGSQAATGWIGHGFYFRWIYPVLLFFVGVAFIYFGYLGAAKGDPDSRSEEAESEGVGVKQ